MVQHLKTYPCDMQQSPHHFTDYPCNKLDKPTAKLM